MGAQVSGKAPGLPDGFLGSIGRAGNKVPHPAIISKLAVLWTLLLTGWFPLGPA